MYYYPPTPISTLVLPSRPLRFSEIISKTSFLANPVVLGAGEAGDEGEIF